MDGRGCKAEKLGTLAEMRRNGFLERKKRKKYHGDNPIKEALSLKCCNMF